MYLIFERCSSYNSTKFILILQMIYQQKEELLIPGFLQGVQENLSRTSVCYVIELIVSHTFHMAIFK